MFNGYILKENNFTEQIYARIDNPKLTITITAFPEDTIFTTKPFGSLRYHPMNRYCNGPLRYHLMHRYEDKQHNLLGPASAYFTCANGKYNVFEPRYFIAGYYEPEHIWKKIITAMTFDKSKSFKELEKELFINYNRFMAYILDKKAIDPVDLSAYRLECAYNYLKNKEIKNDVESILVLNKLTSEGE